MSPDQPISYELDRIVPLGLTIAEARAWYLNEVLMPRLQRGLLVIGLGSMIAIAILTPLGDFLEETLAVHMVVEYFLFTTAGFLVASGTNSLAQVGSRLSKEASRICAAIQRVNSGLNKYGTLTFLSAALLTAYWYLPRNFDTTVFNQKAHAAMQLTFLVTGALIFIGSTLLTKRMRQTAPIIAGKAMGLYGTFLLLTPFNLYQAYPISQQAEAGAVLLLVMLAIDFTVVPILLYNYFGRSQATCTSLSSREL